MDRSSSRSIRGRSEPKWPARIRRGLEKLCLTNPVQAEDNAPDSPPFPSGGSSASSVAMHPSAAGSFGSFCENASMTRPMPRTRILAVLLAALLLAPLALAASGPGAAVGVPADGGVSEETSTMAHPQAQAPTCSRAAQRDLLEVVRGFADAMLVHGVDRWGNERTGMLISLLDCRTLAPFAAMPRAPRGIRAGDRVSLYGANYNTDQNLYQTLYVLSRVTGAPKYSKTADTALADFLTRTASPETGLFASRGPPSCRTGRRRTSIGA